MLLLLSNFHLSLGAFADTISTHVHVAANDQFVVFARNRDAQFHITLSPYESPTMILYLKYESVQVEAVRSLAIPTNSSSHGLVELVFIGEHSNSSEKTLFHVQLQTDLENGNVSIFRLVQKSIASLSSVEVDCAVGIHPLGTRVFVVGNRAGYIYAMNELLFYDWSPWAEFQIKRYPKAVGVTVDNHVIVGAYVSMIDTVILAFYYLKFNSVDMNNHFDSFAVEKHVQIANVRAPMSFTLRGSIEEDGFIMAAGLPSIDTVLLYIRREDLGINQTVHQSIEKGVHFGQAVTLTGKNTYGVLSSALATPPWSTGRVQVRSISYAAA